MCCTVVAAGIAGDKGAPALVVWTLSDTAARVLAFENEGRWPGPLGTVSRLRYGRFRRESRKWTIA
jgi:hypothetical protein